jgi:hypothetical protein
MAHRPEKTDKQRRVHGQEMRAEPQQGQVYSGLL